MSLTVRKGERAASAVPEGNLRLPLDGIFIDMRESSWIKFVRWVKFRKPHDSTNINRLDYLLAKLQI